MREVRERRSNDGSEFCPSLISSLVLVQYSEGDSFTVVSDLLVTYNLFCTKFTYISSTTIPRRSRNSLQQKGTRVSTSPCVASVSTQIWKGDLAVPKSRGSSMTSHSYWSCTLTFEAFVSAQVFRSHYAIF
jgi:hypothetical protein